MTAWSLIKNLIGLSESCVVYKMTKNMNAGFSLIELLVVVAIIGILAAVGVVGYQGYIDAVQDEAAVANQQQLAKAIRIDNISIQEGLGGASDINTGITKTSACSDQIETILKEINVTQGGKSTVTNNCTRGFNGNIALNWPSVTKSDLTGLKDGCSFDTPTTVGGATTMKVPRGSVMVACADSTALVGASNYKIYTCACSGTQDDCITTDVSSHCSGNADPAKCRKDFMANNPSKCPTPNTPQF